MVHGISSLPLDGSGPASGDGLWQSCVDQLAQELPEQQFNTWIKPLHATVSPDLSKVVVLVGNRFKLDWVRAQYASRIGTLLQQFFGQPIQLELAITPKEEQPRPQVVSYVHEAESLPEAFVGIEENTPTGPRNRLNTALTFDSLVEGTANRMARAAAMHVATMPGQLYNPLFIYGGLAWVRPTWSMLWVTSCSKSDQTPKFSTSMQNNLFQMWLRPISAKRLKSSRHVITPWTFY
jgi:chromosomal replication initiator protein